MTSKTDERCQVSAGTDADLDAWLSRSAAAAQSVLDEYAWGEELTIPYFLRSDLACVGVPDLTGDRERMIRRMKELRARYMENGGRIYTADEIHDEIGRERHER